MYVCTHSYFHKIDTLKRYNKLYLFTSNRNSYITYVSECVSEPQVVLVSHSKDYNIRFPDHEALYLSVSLRAILAHFMRHRTRERKRVPMVAAVST